MKATINGIEVEGTPEEIWMLLQRKEGTNIKPVKPMPDWHGPWWSIFPPNGNGTAETPDYLKWPNTVSMNCGDQYNPSLTLSIFALKSIETTE